MSVTPLSRAPSRVLGDLSAAYLLRASRFQRLQDAWHAIDAGRRAIRADSNNQLAQWNLAVALREAQLLSAARAQFKRTSQSATSPALRLEARRAFDTLTALMEMGEPSRDTLAIPTFREVATRPEEARQAFFVETLARWATAVVKNDSATIGVAFEEATRIAEWLARATHDSSATMVVLEATRVPAGAERVHLATTIIENARGLVAYAHADYGRAALLLERVVTQWRAAPTLARWTALYLGASEVYLNRAASGTKRLVTTIATIEQQRMPSLAARGYWMLATTRMRAGAIDEGFAALANAERLYARTGERESLGAVTALRAEAEYALGEEQKAVASSQKALRLLAPFRGSVWLHNALNVSAELAGAAGLPTVIDAIREEDAVVATRTGRQIDAVESALWRLHSRDQGETRSSAAEMQALRRQIASLDDSVGRGQFLAELHLAMIEGQRAPMETMLSRADSAVDEFVRLNNPFLLARALIARARLRMGQGMLRETTKDLAEAMAAYHGIDRSVGDFAQRVALQTATEELYLRIADLKLREGARREALSLVESGRAAFALRARSGQSNRRTSRRPGEVIVDFAFPADTLVTWVLRDSTLLVLRGQSRGDIVRLVGAARAALEVGAPEQELRMRLARVHAALLAPVWDTLARFGAAPSMITIVPGRELSEVPFAALYDEARQQYLVQQTAVRIALSLDEAFLPLAAHAGGRAVIVADPAHPESNETSLPTLAGARREGRSIAALYSGATLLTGESATAGRLLSAAKRADVLHIASHAIFQPQRPDRSFLALAPDERYPEGRLRAVDLKPGALSAVRLLVLSACESVRTPGEESSGLFGFAEGSISAGVGGVVGSLWPVDDTRTVEVMKSFHRAYRRDANPILALQRAQLAALSADDPNGRSPAMWGAWQYVGR